MHSSGRLSRARSRQGAGVVERVFAEQALGADRIEAGEISWSLRQVELGELIVRDALHREESCGGHFREESQTEEGEALRDDDRFAYVGAWEWNGKGTDPTLHQEPLEFEYVKLTQRSYK